MNCEQIESELVSYHFDVLEDEVRHQVEEHLVGCAPCVRSFVGIKRSIEKSEDVEPLSSRARTSLRGAVARELGLGVSRWSWWERPLAAALAAAAVLLAGVATQAIISRPGAPPHAISVRH
jgi:hypothetical protein